LSRESWFLPFLAVVALAKLILALALGATDFPDTLGYVGLADGMLHDANWWRDGGWADGYAPPRLLRPYGYPLLVAAAQLLSHKSYGLLLALSQSSANVAVLALIGWFARHVIAAPSLRLCLLVLCASSGFILFDLAVLPDSFYSSLFVTVFLILAAQMLGLLPPRLGLTLLLGCAWALSITLRDVGLLHSFLPLIGVMLVGYCRRLGLARTLAHAATFALPVVLMASVVVQWNLFRTGHAFFSITGGINWLWPSINMADRGLADPFTCADLVCRTAKSLGPGKGMEGAFGIADALWSNYHLNPVEFGHLTFAHFLGAVQAHPLAFVASMLGNLQFGHFSELLFNPLANADELSHLHAALGHHLYPGIREIGKAMRAGAWWQAAPLLLLALLSLGSALALVVTMAGTPIRAVRGLRYGDRRALVVMYFWTVAAVFIASYCVVHMEMRHALPTVPLLLLAFGWTIGPWWKRSTASHCVR
jgi:hypothetical protein